MCYFTRQAQKITIYRDFNMILGKNQDGNHFWWRHSPPAAPSPRNIPHLVLNIKGFPLKAKSFLNTATYQKLWGGVPSTSGLSLVPRWGYEFACKSEGWVRKEMYRKICGKRLWYLHRHASTSLISDNQTVAEICWASVIGSAQFSIVC